METWHYIAIGGGGVVLIVLIALLVSRKSKGAGAARSGPSAGTPNATMAVSAFVPGQSLPPASASRARPDEKTQQQGVVQMCGNCGTPMSPEWTACASCGWQLPASNAQFEVRSGPMAGAFVPLAAEITTIGSMDGNALVLRENNVGRKAVGVRHSNGSYELADLGNPGGILVNGQRMAKRALVPGDVVRVGSSELVFRTKA